jgi:epoxyqueuosine reductase
MIVLLSSYKHDLPEGNTGIRIASYAHGLDYHRILKRRMHSLASVLIRHDHNVRYRVFTDSAPLFERSLAHKAGLGFIGKNSFLISPIHGLHTFLSVIITDMELYYGGNDPVITNKCGECRRCIDACPTGAIAAPFRIDARRCISYNTIENRACKGEHGNIISKSSYIFGCDICMDACPWSRKGETTSIREFMPLETGKGRYLPLISRDEWNSMDREEFDDLFKGTALERAGLEKIKSNIGYVVANNNR